MFVNSAITHFVAKNERETFPKAKIAFAFCSYLGTEWLACASYDEFSVINQKF